MKFTGFIKEYDNNIPGTAVSELLSAGFTADDKSKIVDYLKNGKPFVGIMEMQHDLFDNEVIGPCEYRTDGVYVWPGYYQFYVNKYSDCYIDEEFARHFSSNSEVDINLSESDLKAIEQEFMLYWCGKLK